MEKVTKGVAKRLIFSLLALSALGGCAVYGPPGPYVYGTDTNGQPLYEAAPVYAAPSYYYPYPYPYYSPYNYDPVYLGPPVFFNFGISSRSGGGFHGGGRGFRGGGARGSRGGGGGSRR